MRDNFLKVYLESFGSIEGAFQYDAALLFLAYHQLITAKGISGDALEIGVREGLSAIAVAALRGEGRRFFAVDLFDDPRSNAISSDGVGGVGDKAAFTRNLGAFYENLDFLRVIQSDSTDLKVADLGSEFSFCHIDGGHSAHETYHDLELCANILLPGGLLALDDYFNPWFPGVCEGAVKFMLDHRSVLMPIAIGFNKVLFQKSPSAFSLNASFSKAFSYLPKRGATLWHTPVHLFVSGLSYFFDLSRSTPGRLTRGSALDLSAEYQPQQTNLTTRPGETIILPVKVINKSTIPFQAGHGTFGLSYHLLSDRGVMLCHDNARNFFEQQLIPGEERIVDLSIVAPKEVGHYLVEIDIVWEGVAWFRDKGNPTSIVDLTVTGGAI